MRKCGSILMLVLMGTMFGCDPAGVYDLSFVIEISDVENDTPVQDVSASLHTLTDPLGTLLFQPPQMETTDENGQVAFMRLAGRVCIPEVSCPPAREVVEEDLLGQTIEITVSLEDQSELIDLELTDDNRIQGSFFAINVVSLDGVGPINTSSSE